MLNGASVRAIIAEAVKGVELSDVKDDEVFQDFGIDSLDHSLILLAVEEKSGKKIPDEALEECSTIDGIVAFLRNN